MIKNKSKIKTRTKPVQKRAIVTKELILKTALDYLTEVGADAFSTKVLADRADIRIRTVYRYFPNKLAIFSTLAHQMSNKEFEFIDSFNLIRNPEYDWQEALNHTMDSFWQSMIVEPGFLAVRMAMQSSPQLKKLDEQTNFKMAELLHQAIMERGIDQPDEKIRQISEIVVETTTAILIHALNAYSKKDNHSKSLVILTELKKMLKNYLITYIE